MLFWGKDVLDVPPRVSDDGAVDDGGRYAMVCEVCGRGPADGVDVYRVNERGVPGVWRCFEHHDGPIALETVSVVEAIREATR
jgi:hypothetical protein